MKDSCLEHEPDASRVIRSKMERQAFYNKIAPFYDLLGGSPERAFRQEGLMGLAPAVGEHLLEIGVGTGHCFVELAEAVGPQGKVYGIDIAQNMLRKTQSLLQEENLVSRAELVCGDGEGLPYVSGTMDGIFMSFTLELFDMAEIPRVLAECQRVLRPGGHLVVVGMSQEGSQGLPTQAFQWTHQHLPNLLDCQPIFVRRALEAAGFFIEAATVKLTWGPVEIVKAKKNL
jgi:ubiquinone/menaquinone biosynthesis C-methylase UbiE